MTPKIEIFIQKFAHFGRFDGSFLTIFGVKKVVFWTFSKLFSSCLGSVWALFSTLKVPLLVVFESFLMLFTTHTCCSPLGSREALINADKASPGLFIVWVGCGVGVVGCGAYLPLKFFKCLKLSFENILFFRCL